MDTTSDRILDNLTRLPERKQLLSVGFSIVIVSCDMCSKGLSDLFGNEGRGIFFVIGRAKLSSSSF